MAPAASTIEVYIEQGSKRALASAIAWPGWSRGGRDEDAALQSLAGYGSRYAGVLHNVGIAFDAPADASMFTIIERLPGNATSDFGAPDVPPSSDARPLDDSDLQRMETLLRAYWQAFDSAADMAVGKALRTGPRGGGRDLDGIMRHVLDGDRAYLGRLAWKSPKREAQDLPDELRATRQNVLAALAQAAHGELPTRGPRGGAIWTPRFFVRRLGWHVLDHAWEIEDRVISS